MDTADLQLEVIKFIFTLLVGIIILYLGWHYGNKFTYNMNILQKHREIELDQRSKLIQLYGDYYAIWKLYNYLLESNLLTDKRHIELLRQVSDIEAGAEATLLKIASSRKLSENDIRTLGCFRQSCQFFREVIQDKTPITYYWSSHPKYLRFKELSCEVGHMLLNEGKNTTKKSAVEAFFAITDNRWETEWDK